MECGYGCIQVRYEIMVKAWCWLVCRRCFPHCELLTCYCILPDGGLVVLSTVLEVGSTSPDLTFQEWQPAGQQGMAKSGSPALWRRASIARAVSRSARRQTPTDERQPTRGGLGP